MPTLPELQRQVLAAILDDGADNDGVARLIVRGAIAPAGRLGIYANNARGNFIEALRLSFPVVLRLVGEAYFDQCARAYRRAQPSRAGDLHPAGAAFPAFLAERHDGGEYRYLGDVARLEWACQEVLMAADAAPPDPGRFLGRLGAVAPECHAALQFRLHPAARTFHSSFPASAIWRANLGAGEPPVIDLAQGGERLLLLRTDGQLDMLPLSAGEHGFLQALEAAARFDAAVDAGAAAQAPGGDFDAAAALQRFVAAGAIVDFWMDSVVNFEVVTCR